MKQIDLPEGPLQTKEAIALRHQNNSDVCPFCIYQLTDEHKQVEAKPVEWESYDPEGQFRMCSCPHCGRTWETVYEEVGIAEPISGETVYYREVDGSRELLQTAISILNHPDVTKIPFAISSAHVAKRLTKFLEDH